MASNAPPRDSGPEMVTVELKRRIRMLEVRLHTFKETKGMTTEIKDMITRLSSVCSPSMDMVVIMNPTPRYIITNPGFEPITTRHAIQRFPKLLYSPVTVQAVSTYHCLDKGHLSILVGDVIKIYAYIDLDTATGYNTRSQLGGIFPVLVTFKVEPQPYTKPMIVCYKDWAIPPGNPSHLACKMGEYIHICTPCRKWPGEVAGYGFNQNTLTFGKVDPEEQRRMTLVEWDALFES